jgi:hypothetical protein
MFLFVRYPVLYCVLKSRPKQIMQPSSVRNTQEKRPEGREKKRCEIFVLWSQSPYRDGIDQAGYAETLEPASCANALANLTDVHPCIVGRTVSRDGFAVWAPGVSP